MESSKINQLFNINCFFKSCEVCGLVIIHKRPKPNLATCYNLANGETYCLKMASSIFFLLNMCQKKMVLPKECYVKWQGQESMFIFGKIFIT